MLWLFLPFVVILSGVVAYAADTIAKKVGRRHIRWFGMRPKTTALLVAILSGMGISAASLAAFLGLNRNAVNTIAQADQLRPQIDALKREVKSVQGDLKGVQQERDQAQQDAQALAQERTRAMQDLSAAQEKLNSAQADLTHARDAQAKLMTQQTTLKDQIDHLNTLQKQLEGQAKVARQRLTDSETALKSSRQRAQDLRDQLLTLQTSSAQAMLDAQNAQQRSEAAQRQSEAAQQQSLKAQAKAQLAVQEAQRKAQQAQETLKVARSNAAKAQAQAEAARQATQQQIAALNTQLGNLRQAAQSAQAARDAAQAARDTAVQARDQALAQQKSAQQERDRLTAQRDQLVKQRDQAMQARDQVQQNLAVLRQQQLQLQARTADMAKQLDSARSDLAQLRDDYRTASKELSVTRNAELAYQKNDLVYAGLVPSVRNLDTFLGFAEQAAKAHGSRGNDQGGAVRLNISSRTTLETKLRGLNTSSFVQCRATQNSAVGFPVDLTCDARANTVLFRAGQAIRSGNVNVDGKTTQAQITEIVQDAVLELTARGVPSDYINNQGLDVSQFASLLSQLSSRSGTVKVSIAARDDVKPASRVDLYATVE